MHFLFFQCATERANKIPKEIWSDNRLSVSVASMSRDLFVNTNLNYFPAYDFDWSTVIKPRNLEIVDKA